MNGYTTYSVYRVKFSASYAKLRRIYAGNQSITRQENRLYSRRAPSRSEGACLVPVLKNRLLGRWLLWEELHSIKGLLQKLPLGLCHGFHLFFILGAGFQCVEIIIVMRRIFVAAVTAKPDFLQVAIWIGYLFIQ